MTWPLNKLAVLFPAPTRLHVGLYKIKISQAAQVLAIYAENCGHKIQRAHRAATLEAAGIEFLDGDAPG